jgi:hypothetical protein
MISHREMSKSFLYFCVAVLTLTVVSSRAVDGGKFATHEEWAQMMEREIHRARAARSAERRERLVEDLHVHYSKVLQEMDNERMILSQQFLKGLYEATKEKIIPHRYIVFMQDHATDHDLRKVVDILERADSHTNGEYVADHIETFHYIGKGFTATLSESVVNVVSVINAGTQYIVETLHLSVMPLSVSFMCQCVGPLCMDIIHIEFVLFTLPCHRY